MNRKWMQNIFEWVQISSSIRKCCLDYLPIPYCVRILLQQSSDFEMRKTLSHAWMRISLNLKMSKTTVGVLIILALAGAQIFLFQLQEQSQLNCWEVSCLQRAQASVDPLQENLISLPEKATIHLIRLPNVSLLVLMTLQLSLTSMCVRGSHTLSILFLSHPGFHHSEVGDVKWSVRIPLEDGGVIVLSVLP